MILIQKTPLYQLWRNEKVSQDVAPSFHLQLSKPVKLFCLLLTGLFLGFYGAFYKVLFQHWMEQHALSPWIAMGGWVLFIVGVTQWINLCLNYQLQLTLIQRPLLKALLRCTKTPEEAFQWLQPSQHLFQRLFLIEWVWLGVNGLLLLSYFKASPAKRLFMMGFILKALSLWVWRRYARRKQTLLGHLVSDYALIEHQT